MKLIRVYSFPRSGTHFLEAFLARNFYKNKDLEIKPVEWGHWANRKLNHNGNIYGKLFGHHAFPTDKNLNLGKPMIYIFRDPRDVAVSLWKTENFKHPDYQNIDFSSFLRTKLDWYGSPSLKCDPKYTVFEQWSAHLGAWQRVNSSSKNVLLIKFEELLESPEIIYGKILVKFGRFGAVKHLLNLMPEVEVVKEPVGLLPNRAIKGGWKSVFSEEDLNYYYKIRERLPLLPQ